MTSLITNGIFKTEQCSPCILRTSYTDNDSPLPHLRKQHKARASHCSSPCNLAHIGDLKRTESYARAKFALRSSRNGTFTPGSSRTGRLDGCQKTPVTQTPMTQGDRLGRGYFRLLTIVARRRGLVFAVARGKNKRPDSDRRKGTTDETEGRQLASLADHFTPAVLRRFVEKQPKKEDESGVTQ